MTLIFKRPSFRRMKLTFKTIGNKHYQYECLPTDTLEHVIQGLSVLTQKPPQNLTLFLKKKFLDASITVEEAGFTEEQYIVLFISNKPVPQPAPKKIQPQTPTLDQKVKEPVTPIKEKVLDPCIPLPQIPSPEKKTEKQNEKESIKDELKTTPKDELKETPKDELKEEIKEVKPKVRTTKPSIEPLPDIDERKPDPPGFSIKVSQLMELGYPKYDCECALRSALGNLDRAAEYLLSGVYPELPKFYEPAPQSQESQDEEDAEEVNPNQVFNNEEEDEEDDLQEFMQFRNKLIQNPALLRQFLAQMADDNPEMAPLIRRDPAMFLVNVGLNPNDFDLSDLTPKSQYEELMSRFTKDEQTIIHKLESKGFDTMVVIQVFDACDKNEETTMECLMSMQ